MLNQYNPGQEMNMLTNYCNGIRPIGCFISILTTLLPKKQPFSHKKLLPGVQKRSNSSKSPLMENLLSIIFQLLNLLPKLEIFGEDRMRREVAELQKSNRKLTKDCLSEDQATRTVFKSVELTKYKLKDSSDAKCKDLIRTERQVSLAFTRK